MADLRTHAPLTLVTGADGWFGTAFLHELAQHGAAVRALVLDDQQARRVRASHPGMEVVVGDVAHPASLRPFFDGADGTTDVVHAAGVIHPASVADFTRVNDRGTAHVVAAAEAAGVRRLVHVSSNSPIGVNPDPNDTFRNDEPYRPYLGYGRSKMAAELHVRRSSLDHVVVRPPWFYGPHQPARQTTFFTMVRKGVFPVFGDGGQRRSMVYVGNLADGVRRALLAELPDGAPRVYWVADAEAYRVRDIVATVRQALLAEGYDVGPQRLRLPDVVGTAAELGDRLLQRAGVYQQQVHVLGEMNKTIACDITAARTHLGYQPAVALAEGMRASIRWCREQGIEL